LSVLPFTECTDYHQGASSENPTEQQMGNVRGISVAAFRDDENVNGVPGFNIVEGNSIKNLKSVHPNYKVIGVDVQGNSGGLLMQNNVIDLVPGAGPVGDPQVTGVRVSKEDALHMIAGTEYLTRIVSCFNLHRHAQISRREASRFETRN